MPTGQRFTPRWINRPPAEGSSRAIFKWGAPNVFKHPNRRLYSLLKEKLELGDADFKVPRHLGNDPPRGGEPSRLPPRQLTFFKDLLGPENVSTDNHARIRFSTGQTVEENLILREGQVPPLCDGVLHPRRAEDVRRISGEETLPCVRASNSGSRGS